MTQRTKGRIPWEKISCLIGLTDKTLEPQKMQRPIAETEFERNKQILQLE